MIHGQATDAGILCRFCGKRYPNEEITVRSDPEEIWIIEICEGCLKKPVQVEVKVEVV